MFEKTSDRRITRESPCLMLAEVSPGPHTIWVHNERTFAHLLSGTSPKRRRQPKYQNKCMQQARNENEVQPHLLKLKSLILLQFIDLTMRWTTTCTRFCDCLPSNIKYGVKHIKNMLDLCLHFHWTCLKFHVNLKSYSWTNVSSHEKSHFELDTISWYCFYTYLKYL